MSPGGNREKRGLLCAESLLWLNPSGRSQGPANKSVEEERMKLEEKMVFMKTKRTV